MSGPILRRLRAVRAAGDGDRGSASVFVIGMIVVLMVVAGLVVDGGRAINARARVLDDAEQAARAGANQLDVGTLRATGEVRIDPGAADAAARDFLRVRGYGAGDVQVTADTAQVTVQVSDTVPTALLSLIFINEFDVTGGAGARAAVGIVDEIGVP